MDAVDAMLPWRRLNGRGPDAAPRSPIREQRRSLLGLGERHGIADRPPTLPPGDLPDAPGDGPAIRGGQGFRGLEHVGTPSYKILVGLEFP